MRRLVWCAVALAATSILEAQTPPDASASAQAAAAAPAAVATSPRKAEFRIGGFMISGERSYDFSNTVQTATGQIRGVEMLLRGSGAGIYVRSLSGTFGAGQVISADARILLFPPVFTVFVGAGKRVAGQLQLNPTVFYVGMAGISSTVNIGGTGLRTFISGAVLIAPNESVSGSSAAAVDNMGTGLEGEAAVLYRIPRVPIFVQIGYRTEVFMWKAGTMEYPEEVRGIRVGGGIQFGGY